VGIELSGLLVLHLGFGGIAGIVAAVAAIAVGAVVDRIVVVIVIAAIGGECTHSLRIVLQQAHCMLSLGPGLLLLQILKVL
jgi:hypothetical protein